MLGGKLRDLMPVNAEVTDELQVLVLRLAVAHPSSRHTMLRIVRRSLAKAVGGS
jgi:hypothetical protein